MREGYNWEAGGRSERRGNVAWKKVGKCWREESRICE
jgi:hypothetical protein